MIAATSDTAAEQLLARFLELVRVAYGLEKGARANELAGKYVPLRDAAGMHPLSYVTGQYQELYDIVCHVLDIHPGDVQEQLLPNALELRAAARADADTEFRQELLHAAA